VWVLQARLVVAGCLSDRKTGLRLSPAIVWLHFTHMSAKGYWSVPCWCGGLTDSVFGPGTSLPALLGDG
jgi:hypothetical protein